MTLATAAWGHDGLTYSGKDMRQLVGALAADNGVVASGDFLVAAQASPNATVQVAAGRIIVPATGAGLFGSYAVWNDASINSPSFSPTSGNGRWDYLILRVTAGVPALEIVAGTAAASPAAPTITGDNYEPLALVKLPGSTTNVTNAMITDVRNQVVPSTTQPTHAARAYRNAALSISAVSTQIIQFDAESYDYGSNFTTGASAAYTAPTTGLYHVKARAGMAINNATTPAWLTIYKNGVAYSLGSRIYVRGGTIGDDWAVVVEDDIALTAADTVSIYCSNGSVAGFALQVGASQTYVSVTRVDEMAVRFLRESILSGEVTEIELDGWSYTDTLNRPGALSASVPLNSIHATEELLDPWRTAIYAVRGTTVEWGGILLPPTLSVGSNSLDVNCLGWLGYWDHRTVRNTVGQPEAGGLHVYKPNADATTTDVFGLPNTTDIFANVAGGYSRQRGVWSDFSVGATPAYQARFDVPDAGLDLHPIVSVRVGIVATGIGANNTVTPRLVIGGTDYNGTAVAVPVWAPYIDCSYTWTLNPATATAWTPADIYAFASSSSAGYATSPTEFGLDTVVNQLSLTVSYGDGFSDFFADTDQFEIFRALVLDAQSEAKFGVGYDLGIDVVWDELSGVTRDRTAGYQPHLAKNLGEALRQLGALEDGFDYGMEYALNPTTDGIDKHIRLHYPTKGRDTGFLFEYERGKHTNVMARGFADPVDFAWTGDGWGSGNDETRLRSPYIDETLRTVYPPYDAAPTFSSVILQTTLDENTEAAFARTNRPKRIPVISVDPGMYPQWGDYTTGDTVGVKIDDGYGSMAGQYRITGTKVADGGAVELVLADLLGDVGEEEA